jgi:hypothetical protein
MRLLEVPCSQSDMARAGCLDLLLDPNAKHAPDSFQLNGRRNKKMLESPAATASN